MPEHKDEPRAAQQVGQRIVTPDELRRLDQESMAEVERQARERRATETVPGGRYLLDDGTTMVDANGQPVKD
jgi:hypothetical protein